MAGIETLNDAIRSITVLFESDKEGNDRIIELWKILGKFEEETTKEVKLKTINQIIDEVEHYKDMYL